MLEGVSVLSGRDGWRRASAAFGEESASFLAMHSEADEDHLPKAFAAVAGLPEQLQGVIRSNCRNSFALFRAMLRDVVARATRDAT